MATIAAAIIARRSRRPDAHDGGSGVMIIRSIIVGVAALLLAAQVVRDAAVTRFAVDRPATAAGFWASHPATEISAPHVRGYPEAEKQREHRRHAEKDDERWTGSDHAPISLGSV